MTPENVIAIYNTELQQVTMIVVDAVDLSDPAWNPPNSIQLPVDPVVYKEITQENWAEHLQTIASSVLGIEVPVVFPAQKSPVFKTPAEESTVIEADVE